MYGVLRSYSGDGAKKLAARLEERKADVEALVRGVPGLISWGLMRTSDGCTTFTLTRQAPIKASLWLATGSRRTHRMSALRHQLSPKGRSACVSPRDCALAVRPASVSWAVRMRDIVDWWTPSPTRPLEKAKAAYPKAGRFASTPPCALTACNQAPPFSIP